MQNWSIPSKRNEKNKLKLLSSRQNTTQASFPLHITSPECNATLKLSSHAYKTPSQFKWLLYSMKTFTADLCGSFLHFLLSPGLFIRLNRVACGFNTWITKKMILDCIILMLKQKTELYYSYKKQVRCFIQRNLVVFT